MVRFRFWVKAPAWRDGGYENVGFANNVAAAKETVNAWNREDPGRVILLNIEEITHEEFSEDYCGVRI